MAEKKHKLIYADDLLSTLRDDKSINGANLRRVIQHINAAPAVEVVRCEKCLYRSQYCDENGLYKCGGLQTEDVDLVLMVKPDFFCAFGERRGKMDGGNEDA